MKQGYHHGDLKRALLRGARRHIAREGEGSLSVRSLARDAGVAHRAAYQHFPDKAALLAATYADAYRRLARRLERATAAANGPEDELLAAARAYTAFAFAEPNMFLAISGPRLGNSYDELERAIARVWKFVAGPIGKGIEAGDFAPADRTLAAAVFWCGLQGVLQQAVLRRLKVDAGARDAFFDDVARRLVKGVRKTD